ncbi:MAG TPA: radical SAM protein, partial [Desulfosarcina sp.]|nr:radical SAM protein [Desulfosarcina sp.]
KPAERVIREVDHLVARHRTLSLAFSDNAIHSRHAAAVFEGIRKLGTDLSIFVELRAPSTVSMIRIMRQAGVDTVQVGIEALSSRLLRKMNKGVRSIDNLCMMKHCEAAGIVNASNLMLHFPSSDADDVAETLNALAFCRWFRPLKTVSFWLGMGSPVHRHPRRFHIRAVFNHPNLKKLFPQPAAGAFGFMIQGYRGDRQRQQRLWQPVKKAVRQWQTDYDAMMRQTGGRPALTFRDGGRFMIIDQHLPERSTMRHRLTGVSAEIYRTCDMPRTLAELAGKFASHDRQQIRRFCRSMIDKRLMFGEADSFLSLAVPQTWQARP